MNYRQILTYGVVLIIFSLASCSWRTINDEGNKVSFLVKHKEWIETDYATFRENTSRDPYAAYFSDDKILHQNFLLNKKNNDRVRYGTVKLTDSEKQKDLWEIFSKDDNYIKVNEIVWRFESSEVINKIFIDDDPLTPPQFFDVYGSRMFCVTKTEDHLFMFVYNLFDGDESFQRFRRFLEGIKFLTQTRADVNKASQLNPDNKDAQTQSEEPMKQDQLTESGANSNSASKYYRATSNLRLRSEPDTSKNNIITTINEGDRVEFLEAGRTDYIDNISAPWYRIKITNGTTGWVFSGFLSETR